MASRRQQLLSQLKNNLDIASKAIGFDKSKPDVPVSEAYHQRSKNIDLRAQTPDNMPSLLFPVEQYPHSYGRDQETYSHLDNRSSYNDRVHLERPNPKPFLLSAADIESEDAFLYGPGQLLPERNSSTAQGYSGAGGGQMPNKVLSEKINFLFHGNSTNKNLLPGCDSLDDAHISQFSQQAHSNVSYGAAAYGENTKEVGIHTSVSQNEAVNQILKNAGLDSRISGVAQELFRKDLHLTNPSQKLPQSTMSLQTGQTTFRSEAFVPQSTLSSLRSQALSSTVTQPSVTSSFTDSSNWDLATQQFLNKLSGSLARNPLDGPTGIQYPLPPKAEELPFGSQCPNFQNKASELEAKVADSPNGLESHLFFKPKRETAAIPSLSVRPTDPVVHVLNGTLSDIRVLEEVLTNLSQSKMSMMLQPPGSQRDSLMLQNMRMQEEISSQIVALKETAKELASKLKNPTMLSPSSQQVENYVKDSQMHLASHSTEELSREPSTSKQAKQSSVDKGSQSRSHSHSRGKRKHKSRSRSRDRKKSYNHRYHRSRDNHHKRHRDRSRSRERQRSHGRNLNRHLSEADRKALGYGTEVKKTAKSIVQKTEDKEKKALEMALSMYMTASEFYNGTNIWCQKCDLIFNDVFGLCQHLHSEKHQTTVDPNYNKPRPPYVPEISSGVSSAPSRGYEFVLPLQAFFCSLCCEFSKDIAKAEEHIKSLEHNKKFKQFLNDNPDYELRFLKDVTTAIAQVKVAAASQAPESQKDLDVVSDDKKIPGNFLNPENNSEVTTREKFQFKFTGPQKQGVSKLVSKSPDLEITNVIEGNMEETKNPLPTTPNVVAKGNSFVQAKKDTFKNVGLKTDQLQTKGWVLKADAHLSPQTSSSAFLKNHVAKAYQSLSKSTAYDNSLKVTKLDNLSSDKPKPGNADVIKVPLKPPAATGKMPTGKLPMTSTSSNSVPTQKSEEAVVNFGDFEIFDEC